MMVLFVFFFFFFFKREKVKAEFPASSNLFIASEWCSVMELLVRCLLVVR